MLATKYIASVKAAIVPFQRNGSKSSRLFLNLLMKESARQANTTKIETIIEEDRKKKESLHIVYKDGKTLDLIGQDMKIDDLIHLVNAHSKVMSLKEQIS